MDAAQIHALRMEPASTEHSNSISRRAEQGGHRASPPIASPQSNFSMRRSKGIQSDRTTRQIQMAHREIQVVHHVLGLLLRDRRHLSCAATQANVSNLSAVRRPRRKRQQWSHFNCKRSRSPEQPHRSATVSHLHPLLPHVLLIQLSGRLRLFAQGTKARIYQNGERRTKTINADRINTRNK